MVYSLTSDCGVIAYLLVDSFVIVPKEVYKSHIPKFLFKEPAVVSKIRRLLHYRYKWILNASAFNSINKAYSSYSATYEEQLLSKKLNLN